MTLATKIAWDDTVLPFQLDRSDIRGRIVRLDGVLDQLLSQHDYPLGIEALVAEAALLTALIGQTIKLRYLIRAGAVKSANDASTALAEAIEGSGARFARRMNRTAKALGMTRTHFKNVHCLTDPGSLSTVRFLTILGRPPFYGYPHYYNLFSRITADIGVRTVRHTNR